jgi:uncharacterized protein (DUF302 family)
MAEDGLITVASRQAVGPALARIEAALKAAGVTVFARIDHAAGAAQVGLAMPPMTVLIFGNPQAGTPLMQAQPTVGLDLPLKLLVWEDRDGRTWLTYSDPAWIAGRHGLPADTPPVRGIAGLLAKLAAG